MKTYSALDSDGIPFDKKLGDIIGYNNDDSIYIELGACDGLFQSNTKLLEETYGYKGILIEPSKEIFSRLIKNRSSENNEFINKACKSFQEPLEVLMGDFSKQSPMSSINGTRLCSLESELVEVQCETLSSIIDGSRFSNGDITLLVVDTEGYEFNVLSGIDFSRHKPKYILVEIYTQDFDKIKNLLEEKGYIIIDNFSGYTKEKCPHWDGSHNDYLFKKI